MRKIVQAVSWLALAATILPAVSFLTGSLELDNVKLIMNVAMVGWFVATPLWMGREGKG